MSVQSAVALLAQRVAADVRLLLRVTTSVKTGNYTVTLSDWGKTIEMDSATAAAVTFPADAVENFPVGWWCDVFWYGAGTTSVAVGSGAAMLPSVTPLRARYSTATVRKRASNTYVVSGDVQ